MQSRTLTNQSKCSLQQALQVMYQDQTISDIGITVAYSLSANKIMSNKIILNECLMVYLVYRQYLV